MKIEYSQRGITDPTPGTVLQLVVAPLGRDIFSVGGITGSPLLGFVSGEEGHRRKVPFPLHHGGGGGFTPSNTLTTWLR